MRLDVHRKNDHEWSAPRVRIRNVLLLCVLCAAAIQCSAGAATYYISPNGRDSDDGLTRSTPWLTIKKAVISAQPHSTIYLMEGNHGYHEVIGCPPDMGRHSWNDALTFTPDPQAATTPYIERMWMQSTGANFYVIFDGVTFTYPDTGGPFPRSPLVVHFGAGNYVKILNCKVTGILNPAPGDPRYRSDYCTSSALRLGVAGSGSGMHDVYVDGCTIRRSGDGIYLSSDNVGDNVEITNNDIGFVSTNGVTLTGVPPIGENVLVQGNNIHNQAPLWATDYSMSSHGSGFYINTDNVTVNANRIHAFGNTAAIRTYPVPADVVFDNVIITNNLIYHPVNFAFQMFRISSGVKINNNTVIGVHRGETGAYYFGNSSYRITASIDSTVGDTSGIEICNNIFLCLASDNLRVAGSHWRGNLVWAFTDSMDQSRLDAAFPGNKVYCWGDDRNKSTFLASDGAGFFAGGPWFASLAFAQATLTDQGYMVAGDSDPGDTYGLSSHAFAIGFADPACSPPKDIRLMDRDAAPDAGCYEYKSLGNPVFNPIGDKTATVDTLLTFEVSATDPNGDALTYSASGLPQGATFLGQTFAWTPTSDQTGEYHVTFTADDGHSPTSTTITITVAVPQKPNSPPVLGSIGNKSINENQLLSFSVSATDADGQDTLTYSTSGLPSGATFSGEVFNWEPSYSQAGSYHVTFTVNDGRDQDSETVTISVANVNRTPTLSNVSDRSVDTDSTLTFSLSATDPDGDPLTYSASGLPGGATLAGRDFTWTPTSDQAGSYEITFIVSDGSLGDSRTASVVVVAAPPDTTAPVVARCAPEPDAIQVPLNNVIMLHVTDAGKGVDAGTVVIQVNDQVVYEGNQAVHTSAHGRCSRSGNKSDYRYIYQPDQMSGFDQTMTVRVGAADLRGNVMNPYSYSFVTEMRSFGANKQVSAGTGASGTGKPVTVRDKTGSLWIAWHEGPQDSRDVYVSKLTSDAESSSAPMRLTTEPTDQCSPDLVATPDGKVYLAWQDNRRGNWDIMVSVCSDGQNFSRGTRVTDSSDNEINPVIAADGQSPSRVYIAWQDDRDGNQDIYVASSTNAFVSKSESRITANAADQTQPDIAIGEQNAAYVFWTDMRNGQADIYGASSNIGPWTNVPVVAAAGAQTDPAVAAEPGGSTLHLLWVDNAGGDQDIYYASLAGLPSSPVTGHDIVDDTSGADQISPAVACAESGKVFACWRDARHVGSGGSDTDLYFAELRSDAARANVLVGDDDTNTGQSEPAMGVNAHDQPYLVWSDDRAEQTQVYYTAATFIDPNPLDSKLVAASAGATVGAEPSAIDEPEDVSIVVPPGACPADLRVTISHVVNPQVRALQCMGSYDFGPSGIDFDQPVTITIPYRYSPGAGQQAIPYWYDSLTGVLSQQGITDVESVVLASDLNALRFKTIHFTPFYLVAGSSESSDTPAGGSSDGLGGCSMSATGRGSPKELLVPYAAIAAIMILLRRRDRRRQKILENIQE